MNEKKNYENSFLDLESNTLAGRFIETCERPAFLKNEVRRTNFADRALKGQKSDFGGLKPTVPSAIFLYFSYFSLHQKVRLF